MRLCWLLLGAALSFGCGTKGEPAPAKAPGAPDAAAPAKPAEAPDAAPPSAAGPLRCARLFPKELIEKTHGASEARPTSESEESADCELIKEGTAVGIASAECRPGLDPKEVSERFKVEREVMAAAKELSPMVGRDGYRLGDTSFTFLDDDAPCVLKVSWVTPPAAPTDALRAFAASLSPSSLR